MIVPLTTNTVLFIAVAQTVTDSRVMTSTRGTEWSYQTIFGVPIVYEWISVTYRP